jgi:hypothetical protein
MKGSLFNCENPLAIIKAAALSRFLLNGDFKKKLQNIFLLFKRLSIYLEMNWD